MKNLHYEIRICKKNHTKITIIMGKSVSFFESEFIWPWPMCDDHIHFEWEGFLLIKIDLALVTSKGHAWIVVKIKTGMKITKNKTVWGEIEIFNKSCMHWAKNRLAKTANVKVRYLLKHKILKLLPRYFIKSKGRHPSTA